MNGMVSMTGVGTGNMGMGNLSAMGQGNTGMNGMYSTTPGNMGVMGSNSLGMSMGTGPSGMRVTGPDNMSMHGSHGTGTSRTGVYCDGIGDNYHDDYDAMQNQPMMGRGGGPMGGQPHHVLHINHNSVYGGSSNNNIRRPVVMRQGTRMDQMHGDDHSHSQRQPDFFQEYSQQPQAMIPAMHVMQQQQPEMYNRAGSAATPGLQDDYSTSSNGGNMPHRPVPKMTGPRV